MSRIKIAIAVLCAAAALSAVTAGTASASWFVGGTELAAGKTVALATTAKVDGDLKLLLPSLKITILCQANILSGVGPFIQGGNTGGAERLIFTGCGTTEPVTGCDLAKSEIPTTLIKATAVLGSKAPEDRVTFTPATKTQFTEIPFLEVEAKCSLEGNQPLTGSVTVAAPTGQSEEEVQAIEGLGSVENNSLQVGAGNHAYIDPTGKALLKLASGSKWSFR